MRLWHQSRTELDRLPAYREAMADHFTKVAEPETTIHLHGMMPGTYVSEYPGRDAPYIYFAFLHSLQILNNVRQAEAEGYDAFLLMNLPETVHEEAQTLVDIPVVAYGQAAMYAAAMLGRRFAIVAMIQELLPLYESHIVRYGMTSRAQAVRWLGLDHGGVFSGFENPMPVIDAMEARAKELASEGVDVIIPGEAPLAAVLAKAGVSQLAGLTIVDALGVTVKFGESMVKLAVTSGQRPARGSYYTDTPPAGRIDELERFYRLKEFGEA